MGPTLARRDFIKYCAATAAVLGLSQTMVPKVARALERLVDGRTPVIWLMGQGCGGCQASLLDSDRPTPAQLLLDTFSLRFFPLLSSASGELALASLNETAERFKGDYVLLMEGTVPVGEEGRYATMGRERGKGLPVETWLRRLAVDAKATFAIGTCAAYGGVPALGPTSARTIEAVLQEPVTAVPGCPPHPDWIVGTLVKLVLFGPKALTGELDGDRRPTEFFGTLVHDNCPRRSAFDAGVFAGDFNDNLRPDNPCLLNKGCKGPVTHADCSLRRWNQRVNWCIGAGAPCNGCTEPSFYAGLAPLFDRLPSVDLPWLRPARVSAETLGGAIAGATAIGVGAHLVAQVARGRIGTGTVAKGDRGDGKERHPDGEETPGDGTGGTAAGEESRSAGKERVGCPKRSSEFGGGREGAGPSIEGFYGPRRPADRSEEKPPRQPGLFDGKEEP
ncbi:MAG: twin-arginine translocation signal domain-containing protein [Actinobacteria bacterium]|nr:MAG: twin-arginine translocation signal domain-containing protein [Actinomycetota bacterium]